MDVSGPLRGKGADGLFSESPLEDLLGGDAGQLLVASPDVLRHLEAGQVFADVGFHVVYGELLARSSRNHRGASMMAGCS